LTGICAASPRVLLALALLALPACPTPPGDDTADDDDDGADEDLDQDGWVGAEDCDDGDAAVHPGADEACNGQDDDCDGDVDEGNGPFSVSVTWDIDLFVEISGGAGTYDFGMAETGVGEYGWFGETCIPGDEPYGYPDYGVDVCHTLGSTGGTLVSVSPNVGDVDDGYTLFNEDIGNDGTITYALFQIGGDACWVWGDDPLYYAAFGCIVL
jgi:hypothetical protein